MRCSRAEELMSLSLDGEATSEETRQLQEHIRQCGRCVRRWQSFRRVSAFLRSAPDAEPSINLASGVMERIGAVEAAMVETKAKRSSNAIAAIVLAVLAGSLTVDLLLALSYITLQSGISIEPLSALINVAWDIGSALVIVADIAWDITLRLLVVNEYPASSSVISLGLALATLWVLILKNYRGVPVQR